MELVPPLTFHVIESLCKSYKTLLAMKQPSEQQSRKVGRLLATTLHEPRYWYAADALDLVDLSAEVTDSSVSPDRLRKFLQLRVPSGLLDREGKERRKLDDIEKSGTPPSCKSSMVPSLTSYICTKLETNCW